MIAGRIDTQNLEYTVTSERNQVLCKVKVSHCENSRLEVTSTRSKLQIAQGDNKRNDDVDEQATVNIVG